MMSAYANLDVSRQWDMKARVEGENALEQIETVCEIVTNGNLNILEILCENDIPRYALDGLLDERPLSIAARLQCRPSHETAIGIIKVLLDNGANINIRDTYNRTPILNAMLNRDSSEIVKLLVERGADVKVTDRDNRGVLHDAVSCCGNKVLRKLIKKGAGVCIHDVNGRTPLHEAARGSSKEVVNLLIANGANVCAKDNVGRTVLHEAMRNRSEGVVKILIGNGTGLCVGDNTGWTPFHEAIATRWRKVNFLKYLVRKGAGVCAKDDTGWTPLHQAIATRRKDVRVVKFLVGRGAEVCAEDNNGWTPLHEAIIMKMKYASYESIVNLLIDKGADFFVKDNRGLTPYHIAIIHGWPLLSYLKILLWKVNCDLAKDERLEWLLPGHRGIYVDAFFDSPGHAEHLLILNLRQLPGGSSPSDIVSEFDRIHRLVQCGCGINRERELNQFLKHAHNWWRSAPYRRLRILLYLISAGIYPKLDTFTNVKNVEDFKQTSTNSNSIRIYDALISECVEKLTQVRSLKTLCRDKLRRTLYHVSHGKEILSIIHGMPDIPPIIASFLSLDGLDAIVYYTEGDGENV